MSQEILPITGLKTGTVNPNVIVCGDPQRASTIAGYLQNSVLLNEKREYRAYHGRYRNQAITVCSHGVGAPGAAIAFEELITAGARRLIRVGTCGGLQSDIKSGHLVIASAAVQNTGYGRELAPSGYPAVADPHLTIALQESADDTNQPFSCGLVLTRDVFYGGVATSYTPDYRIMSQANVLAVEMECAALFIIGQLRKVRTAAILAVDGNVLEGPESMDSYKPERGIVSSAIEAAIVIALNALL